MEHPLISEMLKFGEITEKKIPNDVVFFGGLIYKSYNKEDEEYEREE